MTLRLALALSLVLVAPAVAQEDEYSGCTMATAIYAQPSTDWTLRFKPVPRDSSPNQRNAFTIAVPGTKKVIEGGVYIPNGFTRALGDMQLDCTEDDSDFVGCSLWQGTVYGDGAGGLDELEPETARPPLQILFPGFASTLWYTNFPDVQFRNIVPLDVFTFRGCGE